MRLENDIRESFIRDEYVIAVFLDIEKAFDSVCHVIHKEKTATIDPGHERTRVLS